MSPTTEAKERAALGLGGIVLVAYCIAGPAVLGAIGGAASGSVVIGAVLGAAIALTAYAVIRRFKIRRDSC